MKLRSGSTNDASGLPENFDQSELASSGLLDYRFPASPSQASIITFILTFSNISPGIHQAQKPQWHQGSLHGCLPIRDNPSCMRYGLNSPSPPPSSNPHSAPPAQDLQPRRVLHPRASAFRDRRDGMKGRNPHWTRPANTSCSPRC